MPLLRLDVELPKELLPLLKSLEHTVEMPEFLGKCLTVGICHVGEDGLITVREAVYQDIKVSTQNYAGLAAALALAIKPNHVPTSQLPPVEE